MEYHSAVALFDAPQRRARPEAPRFDGPELPTGALSSDGRLLMLGGTVNGKNMLQLCDRQAGVVRES